MARLVRWTLSAADDVERACEFIAQDSPAYASHLASRVMAAADSLAQLSERGRHVPEVNRRDVRELFVDRYRLVYRVEDQAVFILAFIHSARQLPAARILDGEELD